MPCDTLQTSTVEFGANTQTGLLIEALNSIGLHAYQSDEHLIRFGRNESFNKQTGEMRVASYRDVREIKRAYSTAVVKAQAKRFGWQLKETGTNQFTGTKR